MKLLPETDRVLHQWLRHHWFLMSDMIHASIADMTHTIVKVCAKIDIG